MNALTCYIDKQYLPLANAGVPATDLLVQRGYGIFDYLRVANNKPLFLEDHLDRFYNSATIMRLGIAETREDIVKIVYQLIERNNLPYSGIRLIIGGGDSADGYQITAPRLLVLQQPLTAPPEAMPLKGIKLASYEFQRQLWEVKTTDYLMAIWLQPWMKAQNAEDILYHQAGIVRECPRSNFFMIKDGTLITPASHMLKGITRKNIISIALANNIKIEERDIALTELKTAQEAFISSSTKRITPVSQIDDYILPVINEQSLSFKIFELLREKELH